jgi:hypothetical protein
VVEFIKKEPDSRRGIEYPQGMRPDKQVDSALHALRGAYPWIEFMPPYDIGRPGAAETSEELDRGEYGRLGTQLNGGYSLFVAMLAPRGEGYIVENLFQGYVERGVLEQALFDLVASDVGGNSSDVEVLLDPVELTESGGGVKYFTVNNEGDAEADLSGFTLQVQDSETGDTGDCSGRIEIGSDVRLAPGKRPR